MFIVIKYLIDRLNFLNKRILAEVLQLNCILDDLDAFQLRTQQYFIELLLPLLFYLKLLVYRLSDPNDSHSWTPHIMDNHTDKNILSF